MSGFRLDLALMKEPLGFIRVLEWVFAILAFASTGSYSGNTTINIQCHKLQHEIPISFKYPFRLNTQEFHIPCKVNSSGQTELYHLTGNHSSSAEFFVTVAVLAFLYCIGILILYTGYLHLYRESNRGPLVDLLVTAAFTFLWLVSSCAWGKGLTDVKGATSPSYLVSVIHACKETENRCTPGALPIFGPLNSSVVSGFLNVILWAGNCWFIYKETSFHKSSAPSVTQQEGTRQP
ncbi:synaptophysin-like protein 2b [Brachyhypopomus gauderio]|uniref:synaptophysin-like protein 2b n=1 Tax=Brachyhypopomus gauderio TaxID=698409 RepID=UPI0040433E63